MEFFEKAHSLKNADIRKGAKSEEKIKKQLKQMLHGYKKCDNELIRKSEENIIDDLDSTSVSGFSDLNLTFTGSESDNETTMATLDSSDLDSVSNLNDESAHLPCKIPNLLEDTKDNDLTPENKTDSSEAPDNSTSSLVSSISIPNSSETFSPSDSSSLFDVDGVLASKIHERLKSIKKVPENEMKRKFDDINEIKIKKNTINELNCTSEVENLLTSKDLKKRSPSKELASTGNIQDSFKWGRYILSDYSSMPIAPSPTFVSVTAQHVKTLKFDDVFGHYKNSTMKNISSEQKITFPAFNNMNDWRVEDLDEVDSLAPELGTEINISDADLDLTDPDSSSQVNTEGVVHDDSAQFKPTVDSEGSFGSNEVQIEKHQVYSAINSQIIVLRHPANLFIHGKVSIKKLGGSIQIYGYNLQDAPCEVYAPFNNFAQALRTMEVRNDYYGLFNKLTTKGLSVSEAEEIVTNLGCYDAVIALEKLKNLKTDFIENFFNTTNLFIPSFDNCQMDLKRASENLGCSLYASKPYKHIEESPNWDQAIECGKSEKSRGIVCGGKGAGKSTFLRFYVNQLLSQGPVLVIDLDPGQCEFTVAGSVSATIVTEPLLGPNFTHLKKPEIMLNLGIISAMDNPRRYVNAVENLINRCAESEKLNSLPWIVNTMGMCNAIGLKFMCFIIQRVQPTFLLQIELQALKKNFEYRLTSQKVEELCENFRGDRLFSKMPRGGQLSYYYQIAPAETYRTNKNAGSNNHVLAPRDERYLNFLAYFGELVNIYKTADLLGITPYAVRMQDLFVVTNVKLHSDSVTKVLNGKVVALCQQSARPDKAAKVFTLGDKPLLCHGHGLIRGIDYQKDEIYIITPIQTKDLGLVNIIMYADWVPELRGQEKNLPEGTVVPYRTQSQYQQRQLMFTPRRRFNPLQLLKTSRNS